MSEPHIATDAQPLLTPEVMDRARKIPGWDRLSVDEQTDLLMEVFGKQTQSTSQAAALPPQAILAKAPDTWQRDMAALDAPKPPFLKQFSDKLLQHGRARRKFFEAQQQEASPWRALTPDLSPAGALEMAPFLLAPQVGPVVEGALAGTRAVQALGPFANAATRVGRAAAQGATQFGGTALGNVAHRLSGEPVAHDPKTDALVVTVADLFGDLIVRGGIGLARRVANSFMANPESAALYEYLAGYGAQLPTEILTANPGIKFMARVGRHAPGGRAFEAQYGQAVNTLRKIANDAIEGEGYRIVTDVGDLTAGSVGHGGQPLTTGARGPGRGGNAVEKETMKLVDQAFEDIDLAKYIPATGPRPLAQAARGIEEGIRKTVGKVNPDLPQYWQDWAKKATHEAGVKAREAYQPLAQTVLGQPLSVTALKGRIPRIKIPAGVEDGSFFHEASRSVDALRGLGDTITLGEALETQKELISTISNIRTHLSKAAAGEVESTPELARQLQDKVLEPLGTTLKEVNRLIMGSPAAGEGLLVPLDGLKRRAEGTLKQWEASLRLTPETTPGMEPPHILAAQRIMDMPSHVDVDTAHQVASDLKDIIRGADARVGADAADAAERMLRPLEGWWEDAKGNIVSLRDSNPFSQHVKMDGAIQRTLKNINPEAAVLRQEAQEGFAKYAETFNSTLVDWLSTASLDQIANTIVKNAHPHDLTLLRNVLGPDVFKKVGDNWLAQRVEAATNYTTGRLAPGKVLDDLGKLNQNTRDVLFGEWSPEGRLVSRIAPLEEQLRRAWAIQEAVDATLGTTPNFQLLRDRLALTPRDAPALGEEWLAQVVQKASKGEGRRPDVDAILDAIKPEKLPADLRAAMFPGNKLETFTRKLQEASHLEELRAEVMKGQRASLQAVQELKRLVPAETLERTVISDWLSEGLQKGTATKPLKGFLEHLDKSLTPDVRNALIAPEQLHEWRMLGEVAERVNDNIGAAKDWSHLAMRFGVHETLGVGLLLSHKMITNALHDQLGEYGSVAGLAGGLIVTGAGVTFIAAPLLAKMMTSPGFSRMLARGLTLPASSPEWPYWGGQLTAAIAKSVADTVPNESDTVQKPFSSNGESILSPVVRRYEDAFRHVLPSLQPPPKLPGQ